MSSLQQLQESLELAFTCAEELERAEDGDFLCSDPYFFYLVIWTRSHSAPRVAMLMSVDGSRGCEENSPCRLHPEVGSMGRSWSAGRSHHFHFHQVFISVDDLEPPGPQCPEDSRPKPEQDPGVGTPGTAMVEQQQSVEFDSPDSGLPSSRNYSVASGIQSSLDEGQSVGFEEDGGGEEGSDGPAPAAHTFSTSQDPSQDKVSRANELEAAGELAAVCAAAYTVRECSSGIILSWPQTLPAS